MTLSEMTAAGTWSPSDYLNGAHSCHLCGLAPVNVNNKRRPDPASVLLEAEPRIAWRRQSDTELIYRCRNRDACERRQHMKETRDGNDRPEAASATP